MQTTVADFESAAMPHLNDLRRTARRVIGNQADAEEVVQETYLQAWKSFHRFTPRTNCRAWLYKILFHVINHHRRKWLNGRFVYDEAEALLETLSYEPPTPQHLSDEDVIAALDEVPAHYREVILLADVQDFSYQEIARTLQIPMGTVMSRLSRGRKMLSGKLGKFAAAYGIFPAAQAA